MVPKTWVTTCAERVVDRSQNPLFDGTRIAGQALDQQFLDLLALRDYRLDRLR
ncbi:hypothetical protein [Rhizobium leguminosarum]|uniref:hypothetical protein n=1 Tax=Rhizobium leguminosarum TaxID=384 RepID=UPI001440E871|nr:hypothetical protein [Rhizobium leguminosarum]MBY5868235.1 hypothetical protein [Rhizobium leguminosarum]